MCRYFYSFRSITYWSCHSHHCYHPIWWRRKYGQSEKCIGVWSITSGIDIVKEEAISECWRIWGGQEILKTLACFNEWPQMLLWFRVVHSYCNVSYVAGAYHLHFAWYRRVVPLIRVKGTGVMAKPAKTDWTKNVDHRQFLANWYLHLGGRRENYSIPTDITTIIPNL